MSAHQEVRAGLGSSVGRATAPMTFRPGRTVTALLVGALLLGWGCAPIRVPESGGSGPESSQPRPKALTVAIENEPTNLIAQIGGAGTGTRNGAQLTLAVHQRLVTFDNQGGVLPMLAAEVPSQEKGTWVVRPDGSMRTIYRLRPNVTWHDGAPLVADDFVLGWTVNRDRDIDNNQRQIADLIASIETPDPLTLVMEWSNSYPFASALDGPDVGPFPAHILSSSYPADKERFLQHSYWTRDFVGVGPYQVAEWELGSRVVLRAYPAFYAGPAHIDTIIVRFIASEPTVVANLLAGTIDGAIPRSLSFRSAWSIKQQWEQDGRKPLLVEEVSNWRKLFVQFRGPILPEILDVRVRRGLLHGLERQALSDALFQGRAVISDSFIPPDDYRWDWVKDVVATYAFDQRRAQQLLAEAGWHRSGDGPLLNLAGERVAFPVWTGTDKNDEIELAIIADAWKALGIAVDQVVLTGARARDREFVVTFPAFNPQSIS
ncbi:MAG: hypothetical protein HW416_3088, partial [Chloroflexi bacterium]|nr:hypothetical protein [Chloroflexota bacterium]